MIDNMINSYLGLKIDNKIKNINENYYITGSIYCKQGTIGKFINFQKFIQEEIIDSIHYYKNEGDTVPTGFSTKNRVAAFSISAKSIKELKEKLIAMYKLCDILDTEGNSMFLKNVGAHKCLS